MQFFQWLVTSSADPQKTSLFVRGFLKGLVPIAMIVSGITETDANAIVEAAVNVVFIGLSLIAAVEMLWGLGRKAYLGQWSAQ